MPKRGKKYEDAIKKVEHERLYTPQEAVALLREVSYVKFDPTVEVHIRTGLDPRHAEQMVRGEDLAKRIQEGWLDFDVAVATPDMMGVVGRLGRVLGPRGLMPNPRTGTVTMDVGKVVKESKAGRLEYRTDRGANVHIAIGKRSFDEKALLENYAAVIDEIVRAKPAAAKGRYIKKITLASTMGPGIHVDPTRTRDIAEELNEESQEVTATA